MKRTQIYFPKDLYEKLKLGATLNEISVSEYIRKIIKEKVYKTNKKLKVPKKGGNLSLISKNAVSFGIKDLSRNFDKYFEKSLNSK